MKKTVQRSFPDFFYDCRGLINKIKLESKPFYKTYRYTGAIPIEMVDKRGLVDFDLGVFYNRIPKAGSSTIVANLYKIKFKHEVETLEDSKIAKASFLKPSSMKVNEVLTMNKLYKFTVVRNPYTRILSAYKDKITTGKKVIKSLNRSSVPFDDFCRYLEQGGWKENIHWAPQTSIMLIPLSEFDYIGHVESLSSSLEVISQNVMGFNKLNTISRFSPHKTDASDKYKLIYTRKTAKVIANLYKSDFEAFGYDPNDF